MSNLRNSSPMATSRPPFSLHRPQYISEELPPDLETVGIGHFSRR
jgi:hypothetical protein